MERIICLAIGYVCGLLQTGYLVGKMNHVDIRKEGSGNAGSTNALRVLGWKAGAMTFAGDVIKCLAAVLIARYLYRDTQYVPLLAMYAGMGATLGHNFPFYLKFKGGKGIAVLAGLILATGLVMEPEELRKDGKKGKEKIILAEAACVAVMVVVYLCYRLFFG